MNINTKIKLAPVLLSFFCCFLMHSQEKVTSNFLEGKFKNPPPSSRPGVYWYFMDGNISRKGMTQDLESMKKVGIGSVIFLEVNVGVPRGPVDFLSEEWQELFVHAVKECKRLGLEMTLGVGPGWAGSGGPWVLPEDSMQHLVSSSIQVDSNTKSIKLPIPQPKKPFFGEGVFTPSLKKEWEEFYKDVAVLAFPSPSDSSAISNIEKKALYYRAPFTSGTVKEFIPSEKNYPDFKTGSVISQSDIIDLTPLLKEGGVVDWNPPPGKKWTIMRFGSRNNGAITRPAPVPGLGFEADKFDTLAIKSHLDNYVVKLINKIGDLEIETPGGLKMLHIDSWEMGAQNWTAKFRQEFKKRRGYDPLSFYPVYKGDIVENLEVSERFLWDLRQTSQELILENHAGFIKKYAHSYGLGLSIEPYDMNPSADLELGNIADVPMAEFWSKGYGFNSSYSVIEATSVAHINGQKMVPAEAFTADGSEGFKQYPGSMKNQGDWAFAQGLNKLMYHTFQHQPLNEKLKPGMTMGPYGVHWDRNQTWWPMVDAYHNYISRCQYILRQGRAVADILYLTPEGAPHVFVPPQSALEGDSVLPDRKGYNFDGCAPSQLYAAKVKNHRIVFPSGATYRVLILPFSYTMTPQLLSKVYSLLKEGAIVVGVPPKRSPSLVDYPECDSKVLDLVKEIWGGNEIPETQTVRSVNKGKVIFGGEINFRADEMVLYPEYESTAKLLRQMEVPVDFKSNGAVRYTHRTSENWDVYFVSNRSDKSIQVNGIFRSVIGVPQLWDPITGNTRILPEYSKHNKQTTIPLEFKPYESFFIVFSKSKKIKGSNVSKNFAKQKNLKILDGSWNVSFDPQWGGHEKINFDKLIDWRLSDNEGIKYYSGIATYAKTFNFLKKSFPKNSKKHIYIDLGKLKNMAKVKLNGKEIGVVWVGNQLDITNYLKIGENTIEIEVANLWVNRLIGDAGYKDDQVRDGAWPDWLKNGDKRPSKRFTFITHKYYDKNDQLLESGLIGPVKIYSK